jgi:phosphoribosyl-AMP cyclohydrolase / phosphoribosyl-ATP pyrophosphohydrolase
MILNVSKSNIRGGEKKMKEKQKPWSLEDLDQIILSRKAEMPEGSYVASLFRGGTERIAQKVGEEGVEVAIAAAKFSLTGTGRQELIGEIADLTFSLRVLLVNAGIPFSEVVETLRQRNVSKNSKGDDRR